LWQDTRSLPVYLKAVNIGLQTSSEGINVKD